jgi:hypothetical protein
MGIVKMLRRSNFLAFYILLGALLPAPSQPIEGSGPEAAQVIAAEKVWADAALAKNRRVLEELTGQEFYGRWQTVFRAVG